MKRALEEILSKRSGYKKAVQSFHVPQYTLEDTAKKARQGMSIVDASHSCNIRKIFGLVYAQAATLKTVDSALNKTGIYPTNPNVFGEADFTALRLSVNQMRNLPDHSEAFLLQMF
jgi:hypothetical protein